MVDSRAPASPRLILTFFKGSYATIFAIVALAACSNGAALIADSAIRPDVPTTDVTWNPDLPSLPPRYDGSGKLGDLGPTPADQSALGQYWVMFGGGSSGISAGTSVSVDSVGNSYVGGFFYGPIDFGPKHLTANCSPCAVVAKIDSGGKLIWANPFGSGAGGVLAWAIAPAKNGGIYLAGKFIGTITLGPATFKDSGNGDCIVAHLDSNGIPLWAVTFGGPEEDFVGSMATSPSGDLLLAVGFGGTVSFGPIALSAAGGSDIALVKLSSSGNVDWAVRAGGSGADAPTHLAIDGSGSALLAASVTGIASFGSQSTTQSGQTAVVTKVNSSGKFSWLAEFEGPAIIANGVAFDSSGNAYVAGEFLGSASIGGKYLSAPKTSVYVTKLDPFGNVLWANASTQGSALAQGLAVSGPDIYITGRVFGATNFGAQTVTATGNGAIFVAKAHVAGGWKAATTAGGAYGSYGDAIAVHNDGRLLIVGHVLIGPKQESVITDTMTFGGQKFTIDGMRHLFAWNIPAGGL